jgi:hypothetical protein
MSFQKDPPPPGIYDGACAIAEFEVIRRLRCAHLSSDSNYRCLD